MKNSNMFIYINAFDVTGDSGYPLETSLLTPVRDPTTPNEVRYNAAHIKTRNVVERCFGLLKSRFRVLDKTGGMMVYSPEKAIKITMACVVLHNFCTRRGFPAPADITVDVAEDEPVAAREADTDAAATALRRYVIDNFF